MPASWIIHTACLHAQKLVQATYCFDVWLFSSKTWMSKYPPQIDNLDAGTSRNGRGSDNTIMKNEIRVTPA